MAEAKRRRTEYDPYIRRTEYDPYMWDTALALMHMASARITETEAATSSSSSSSGEEELFDAAEKKRAQTITRETATTSGSNNSRGKGMIMDAQWGRKRKRSQMSSCLRLRDEERVKTAPHSTRSPDTPLDTPLSCSSNEEPATDDAVGNSNAPQISNAPSKSDLNKGEGQKIVVFREKPPKKSQAELAEHVNKLKVENKSLKKEKKKQRQKRRELKRANKLLKKQAAKAELLKTSLMQKQTEQLVKPVISLPSSATVVLKEKEDTCSASIKESKPVFILPDLNEPYIPSEDSDGNML